MSIFYILSANSTHARLFLKQNNQLQALKGWTCIRGKVHNRYLVSVPTLPTRSWCNTMVSKAEPPLFARHIAVELEKFCRQTPRGNVVVVATPEFMALLSQFLNPATRGRITCTIAKDKSPRDIDEINARARLLWESRVHKGRARNNFPLFVL